MNTRSQVIAADVAALLRARNSLLWIVTKEEARVEKYLFEAAASVKLISRTWDVAQGVAAMDGKIEDADARDPGSALTAIKSKAEASVTEPCLWIMRDLPAWLSGPAGATTNRQLCNLARQLPGVPFDRAQAIAILTPSSDIPPELSGHATVIEWPLPDREEIGARVDMLIERYKLTDMVNGRRDAVIDAAVGLSDDEAAACFSKSLVQLKRIDPVMVAAEKKRVVAKEKVLEYFEPLAGGLDSVGGLQNLKGWLLARTSAYSAKARAYGLPSPKGCVLVGIAGCGKSLTAKAISTAFGGIPLLRMDMGALKSKFVGESEGNIRRAFKVIEAMGRCVVWIDEIEKAMQGATSGSADGGVSSDALGTFLSWMQERQGEAFVVATANDVEALPPEVLRKGRFDEVWFVDLPTLTERVAILKATLKGFGRELPEDRLTTVAAACVNFTGAELAAIVPEALFASFNDGERELRADDLRAAASTVVPLATTASEKIAKLRAWAKTRARPASIAQAEAVQVGDRALDI